MQFYPLVDLNSAVDNLVTKHNQTRTQQRPYRRVEKFYAKERPLLRELTSTTYEVKNYANVNVQPTE